MSKLLVGLDDAPSAKDTANDMLMAKQVAETLERHYPKHLWAVNVDGSDGLVTIRNLLLSGNWGYRLKIPLIYSASAFEKDVVRAGGEILERFRLARGQLDEAQYATLPTNFAGDPLFEK